MTDHTCGKCGAPKQLCGRTTRYWLCRPCHLAALAARRRGPSVKPVSLAGARERLRAYLSATSLDAIPRFHELLSRKVGFGESL